MLGVFDRSVGKQPIELLCPFVHRPEWISTKEDIIRVYLNRNHDGDTTFYNFPNGNFMALSQKDQQPPQPRSVVVMDDIHCIFFGSFDNSYDLLEAYGLSRRASEAAIVFEAYKTMRDRSPFPPDCILRDFIGSYSFVLFDSKYSCLLIARDRMGGVDFHWGTAANGSLLCCDDIDIITAICGNCYTPFPQGCFFLNGFGLTSVDYPNNIVKGIEHKDDNGRLRAVLFQVDPHKLKTGHP